MRQMQSNLSAMPVSNVCQQGMCAIEFDVVDEAMMFV